MQVRVDPTPPEAWARLALQTGVFYHDPLWVSAVATAFRYRLWCLTIEDEGGVAGGLALAEVPPLLGPRRFVSLPFSYAAGPMTLRPEVAASLATHAVQLAAQRGVTRVEIKIRGAEAPPIPGMVRTERYATYRVDTAAGLSAVWERLHASSTRRSIRKSESAGLVVSDGTDWADWEAMAELQEETSHRYGTPPPPRAWFTETCRVLQDRKRARLLLARTAAGQVAGGIVLWTGVREWIYAFGASRQHHLELRPNHALIWHALRDCAERGLAFDLGRAAPEQKGLVEFKTRWGGQPVPLSYDYWPKAAGLNVASRSQGSLGWAASLWQKLPRPLARAGSRLYRYLG